MRTVAFACVAAACAGGVDAFVGSMRPAASAMRRAGPSSSVRMAADVTVPDLLRETEKLKLLSTASKLGLLSKLEAAGLTLKDVEKLLPLVDENDLIGLAKGVGPDLLKVAPAALGAAPAALPLLAAALGVPGEALYVAGLASFAAGAALVTVLPDDSVAGIALETFVAFPLLFVVPAACAVGGFALTGLKNGSLINLLTKSKPAQAVAQAASSDESSGIAASFSGSSPAAAAAKFTQPKAGRKGSGGRPVVSARSTAAPLGKLPAVATPKKAAPKPAAQPKPMGNIANLPKNI